MKRESRERIPRSLLRGKRTPLGFFLDRRFLAACCEVLQLLLLAMFLSLGGFASGRTNTDTVLRYHIFELEYRGSEVTLSDNPVRDVFLRTTWRHTQTDSSIQIYGFWDGNWTGEMEGSLWKVRFCPTLPGGWRLEEVASNDPELDGQHEGLSIQCKESGHPGFWRPDPESAGRRWFMRCDGSHPYILGNTMYSFISEYYQDGPNGSDIVRDAKNSAEYYNKLRFAITGDIYPHPEDKPFLDSAGAPTDNGDYSHRPNPAWFSERVDLAVRTAFQSDMIADLIINSVDSRDGRSALMPSGNGGNADPILRYMAARYGSYPNVWFCLTNEYNIRRPRFTAAEIARIGILLNDFLGYPAPVSVHPNQMDWDPLLNRETTWNSHVIFQNKIKELWLASDKIDLNYYKGSRIPVINDELAYEGEGDGWSEEDVLEAFLGAFLGGGYGSTGFKSGHKLGHYFAGNFSAAEHSASDNLRWFRRVIDQEVPFWEMSPSTIFYTRRGSISLDIFHHVSYEFRLLSHPGKVYILGTSGSYEGIEARLPDGRWKIVRYDLVSETRNTLADEAEDTFTFDLPYSRAQFVLLMKLEPTD